MLSVHKKPAGSIEIKPRQQSTADGKSHHHGFTSQRKQLSGKRVEHILYVVMSSAIGIAYTIFAVILSLLFPCEMRTKGACHPTIRSFGVYKIAWHNL